MPDTVHVYYVSKVANRNAITLVRYLACSYKNCNSVRGHLQADLTLRRGAVARDVNKIFSINKIKFRYMKVTFHLATPLTKKMMILLAQCALMGRSINYLHM